MTKVIDNTNLGYLISKMKAAFWPKSDVVTAQTLGIDSAPTANSTNLVESGGVHSFVQNALPLIAYHGYVTGSESTYNGMKLKGMAQDTTHYNAFSKTTLTNALTAGKPVFAAEVDSSTGDIAHLYNFIAYNSSENTVIFGEASRFIFLQLNSQNVITTQNLMWTDFRGTYDSLPDKPTIPTVPTISTDIVSDKASDTKTASPKAVYNEVHPAVGSSQPLGGFLPNVMYNLGTVTGAVTFSLASAISGITNHYYWTFEAGSPAPIITWPAGLSWYGGSTPPINANKHYEISVLNSVAVYMEM